MQIIKRMLDEIYRIYDQTGEHATRIYLGRNEWVQLRTKLKEQYATGPMRNEPQFDGKKIYRVVDGSHFFIA